MYKFGKPKQALIRPKKIKRVRQYKNHPVYAIAVPAPGTGWSCKGVIFEPEQKVTEIKRIECPDLTFATKEKAEAHALSMCKTWIDEQSAEPDRAKAPGGDC